MKTRISDGFWKNKINGFKNEIVCETEIHNEKNVCGFWNVQQERNMV